MAKAVKNHCTVKTSVNGGSCEISESEATSSIPHTMHAYCQECNQPLNVMVVGGGGGGRERDSILPSSNRTVLPMWKGSQIQSGWELPILYQYLVGVGNFAPKPRTSISVLDKKTYRSGQTQNRWLPLARNAGGSRGEASASSA